MKIIRILLLFLLPVLAHAQSVTIYLCNDCTYQSSRDKETITFLTNGNVKINNKPAPLFHCFNNDGVIELKYKGKVINHLNWYRAQEKGYELIDDRDIGYSLVDCTGNMPSMHELMNPKKSKPSKRKK